MFFPLLLFQYRAEGIGRITINRAILIYLAGAGL